MSGAEPAGVADVALDVRPGGRSLRAGAGDGRLRGAPGRRDERRDGRAGSRAGGLARSGRRVGALRRARPRREQDIVAGSGLRRRVSIARCGRPRPVDGVETGDRRGVDDADRERPRVAAPRRGRRSIGVSRQPLDQPFDHVLHAPQQRLGALVGRASFAAQGGDLLGGVELARPVAIAKPVERVPRGAFERLDLFETVGHPVQPARDLREARGGCRRGSATLEQGFEPASDGVGEPVGGVGVPGDRREPVLARPDRRDRIRMCAVEPGRDRRQRAPHGCAVLVRPHRDLGEAAVDGGGAGPGAALPAGRRKSAINSFASCAASSAGGAAVRRST